jgi:hypothetical protein
LSPFLRLITQSSPFILIKFGKLKLNAFFGVFFNKEKYLQELFLERPLQKYGRTWVLAAGREQDGGL